MPRPPWTLYAYQVLQLNEQLDLFACQSQRLHAIERQLALATPADRTLCGQLLPAQPKWFALDKQLLRAQAFCPACRAALTAHRKHAQPGWKQA